MSGLLLDNIYGGLRFFRTHFPLPPDLLRPSSNRPPVLQSAAAFLPSVVPHGLVVLPLQASILQFLVSMHGGRRPQLIRLLDAQIDHPAIQNLSSTSRIEVLAYQISTLLSGWTS